MTEHTTNNDDWLAKADNEELLDIVDVNDNVIGQKKRGDIYREGKPNFRVVNVFVENARGQLWILRRSARKSYFPLGLDMSVGGHVKSGETYDDALKRELQEELKIDASQVRCQLLGYLTPQEDGVSAFMKVYKTQLEETPKFNTDEFIEGFWCSPKNILERIERGEKAKDDLPKLLKRFYLKMIDPIFAPSQSLRVKVTDRCPWNCWFCHNEGTGERDPQKVGDINWSEEFSQALYLFRDRLSINEIHLTGGEPTAHPQLANLVTQIKKAGFHVKITSIGSSLETLRGLIESGVDGVNFSLHALTPELLQPTQINRSFIWAEKQVFQQLEAIRFAKNLGINVKLNTVISTSQDYPRVLAVMEWARENNVLIRLLPELKNMKESLEATSRLCNQLGAVEISRRYTIGSSHTTSFYRTSDGYVFGIKYMDDVYLNQTMCLGCPVRHKGECNEKFYGIRLEKQKHITDSFSLYVRLCLHRTETDTFFGVSNFFTSKQFYEILRMNQMVPKRDSGVYVESTA